MRRPLSQLGGGRGRPRIETVRVQSELICRKKNRFPIKHSQDATKIRYHNKLVQNFLLLNHLQHMWVIDKYAATRLNMRYIKCNCNLYQFANAIQFCEMLTYRILISFINIQTNCKRYVLEFIELVNMLPSLKLTSYKHNRHVEM